MKRMTADRRILAFMLCIFIMFTGMYASKMDIDSCFLYPFMEYTLSSSNSCFSKTDATNELVDRETDAFMADSFSEARGKLSEKINSYKYLFSTAVQPYIPMFTWMLFMILLQKTFVDKMYLILFIHNKDGKK